DIRRDVKLSRLGIELSYLADDKRGGTWAFDVSGGFTSTRTGLRRSDTLWKALAKAAVLHEGRDDLRLVLLTTDAPVRAGAGALHPDPDDLVIATKGGLERPGPGQWTPNGRPDHLRTACEGSLRRLRLDQIPLYQLHRPDPNVPLQDSVGALLDLKDEGKLRH